MRARLRQELGDEGAVKTWTDAYLDNLLIEANDWYSRQFPRKTTAYRDVLAGDRTFDVASAYGIVSVECPAGNPIPEDPTAITSDPTPYSAQRYRQAYAVFGDVLYLRNPAGGQEVGTSNLAMLVLLPWDRPDPVEPWNGPEDDEKLLILWAAREAWLWHDGQGQRLNRRVGTVSQTTRFSEQLDRELADRKRRASSRILEVQG
jgi:hypothetical protein